MTTEPTPTAAAAGAGEQAPNPFAGIPASDLFRDALALLLLLVSLAMPWNSVASGVKHSTGHIEVILVTLLSVLSLSLTYLARAKVFGPAVSPAQVGLIRAAANAPYAIVVAIYLVLDIAKVGDNWYLAGGLGYGAAIGLTGAALAGMPRKIEADATSVGALQAALMRLAVPALAVLWVVLSFINFINVFADWAPVVDSVSATVALVISVLIVLVPLALIAAGLIRRSAVARTVTVTAGVVFLGAVIIDWFSDWKISMAGVESVHRPVFGVIAFITLGALASSHLFRDSMRPMADVQRYVRSAGILLLAQAGVVVATAIITVLAIVSDTVTSTGKAVGYLFALVIIGAMAAVAFALVRTGEAATRLLALALTAGTMVVGIVAVILVKSLSQLGLVDLIYAFGLPIATLVLLVAPTSMRAHYGSLITSVAAPAGAAVPPPYVAPSAEAPVAPPVAPPAPPAPPAPSAPESVHPRAAEAADPSTPLQSLFEIASNIPELRAAVAANPSTYPDLLTWLGALGDPAVDAALKARTPSRG